jgi:hypothetical protein
MTHPDPVEIHDHVYGFRVSAHVPGCPDCADAAERLETERRELRDALAETAVEPPADLLRPRRRAPWVNLAAAAGLLAGLVWLLLPAAPPIPPAAPRADDAIIRLIVELKGPSPLRREIALLALKAYGAQAHAALAAAGVDPAVSAAFMTPSAEDVEKEKILDTLKADYAFENAEASRVLDTLVADTRLPATISDEARRTLADRSVTFKVKDLILRNSLKLFLVQFQLDFYVLDGRLHVGPPRVFMTSRMPIRVCDAEDPGAAALVRELGAADFDARGRAIEALRLLDFAAETALWKGLDAPDLEASARAADLLRDLYDPSPRVAAVPGAKPVDRARPVTVSFEAKPLPAALDALRETLNVNFHIYGVPRPNDYEVTFACREFPTLAALRLMVDSIQLAMSREDGLLIVSSPPPDREASPEEGPFWADPDTARRVNAALAGLGSPEAEADLISRAAAAIGPLRAAARRLPEPTRGRARALLIRIYKELDVRLADDPTRSYLASLTPEAIARLDRRVDVDAEDATLPGLLRRFGLTVRTDQPDIRVFTFKVEKVSIRAILDALTRISPRLDWRMEGETVVLDTPGNTRSAVER